MKRANLSKDGPKDRLEMVPKEPTWAKKVPRKTRDSFKRANLGPPEMVSREPTWAKKVPRID